MKFFAMNASRVLGRGIAGALGIAIASHEERDFAGGEHKCRALEDVQGEDVCILSSLHADRRLSANDKICRLLFFAASLKDAGAVSVTLLLPYLAYSRKDRRTKERDPLCTRYLAQAFESAGVDRVVTLDAHNPAALENAWRRPAVSLDTAEFFACHLYRRYGDAVDTAVSPDLGGAKALRRFTRAWKTAAGRDLPVAVVDKQRSEVRVTGTGLIGAAGRRVLIVDDMIGSGTTLCRAATACFDAGCEIVNVAATHGLFEGGAPSLFEHTGIGDIVVTDSVALAELGLPEPKLGRLDVVPCAPLFADSMRTLWRDLPEPT